VFLIYIDYQIAEERFDVIASGGKGILIYIYMDYAILMPSAQGKEKKLNLSVALRANPADWQTAYNDAILNGIEIFKLSGFNRNLVGPLDALPMTPTTTAPPRQLFEKQTRVRVLKILGGVVSGVVVLSIIGFLLFRRAKRVKRGGSSDRTTWWHPFSFSKTKSTDKS
jgi:hypothetical protein